jgi:hypothetical protein
MLFVGLKNFVNDGSGRPILPRDGEFEAVKELHMASLRMIPFRGRLTTFYGGRTDGKLVCVVKFSTDA